MRIYRLLVCLPLLSLACGDEAAPPEAVARPVKILTIGGGAEGGRLEYAGTIEALQHAELGFEVAGRIVEMHAEEGQHVEKGAVLARLDARDYQASLDSERAKVNQAKTELDRRTYLFEQGVEPKVNVERAQRNYDVLSANLAVASKAVEDAALRAPFAGRVGRRLVENHQNVQAKEPVLILQDASGLEIKVAVPERDLVGGRRQAQIDYDELNSRIDPKVVVSSLPDRAFPARLKELATAADPVTRTYQATFAFDDPGDVNVLPGMTAKVTIAAPRREAGRAKITIPSSATLADDSGAAYVWLVDPDAMTVARRPVELGALSGTEVEVTRGLAAGERIAASGVHQLRDGTLVRPFEE
ncbi:MAG: efflux RND transporter periplasmic adaptor subunit [Thermoanaerobaculia bacterium]|nr:efflux RND transporter periplasmic adaptor subunit [Thermoanaerobaculia bacterium]